jgi:hypothetical protein
VGESQKIAGSIEFLGVISMASRLAKNIEKSATLQSQEIAHSVEMENDADDIAWATRSSMWQSRVEKASARRTKRAKAQPALILAGHGVSLRVKWRADRPKWIYTLPAAPRYHPIFPRGRRTTRADYFIGRQRQHFL